MSITDPQDFSFYGFPTALGGSVGTVRGLGRGFLEGTAEMIDDAKEALILRRDTHLDPLRDKLAEPRVRRVISPILCGADLDPAPEPDDTQYTLDLGLIDPIDDTEYCQSHLSEGHFSRTHPRCTGELLSRKLGELVSTFFV